MTNKPREWDDAYDHEFFSQQEVDESNTRSAAMHIEPDKELVLNALKRCEPYAIPDCCNGCPYQHYADSTDECIAQLHADAHELLEKERKPRVLSLEEVRALKGQPILWFEVSPDDENGVLFPVCFERVFMYKCYDVLGVGEPEIYEVASFVGEGFDRLDEYGRTWRLWTDRPDEEQIKEAAWNDCT